MKSHSCMIVLGLTWATLAMTFPILRDDTGLLTVGDFMNAGVEMCGMLNAVNDSLNAPVAHLFGIHNSVMSMKLPILRPSILLDPLGVVRFTYRVLSVVFSVVNRDRLEEFTSKDELMANLSVALSENVKELDKEQLAAVNHIKHSKTEEHPTISLASNATDVSNSSKAVVQFDEGLSNTSLLLNISDVIHLGGLTCKRLEKWKRKLNASVLNQIVNVESFHLPFLDSQHSLNPVKLLHGLHKVPTNMISGAMGFISDLLVGG